MSKNLTTQEFINLFLNQHLNRLEDELQKIAGNRPYKMPNEVAFEIFENNPEIGITDLAYALAEEQVDQGDYRNRPKLWQFVQVAARWMARIQGVDYQICRAELMAKCREVLPFVEKNSSEGCFWFQNH